MYQSELSIQRLQASLDAKIERHFDTLDTDPDVLQQLLDDKRSPNTRRAYEYDLRNFFLTITGRELNQDAVLEFLHLEQRQAMAVALKYKAKLIQQGLKEATVNRRIAAIKSLVKMGRKLGVCAYSLDDIESEKVQKYRDTTGVDPDVYRRILAWCDLSTLKGKRDYAILRLLWDNALRRGELVKANKGDFDAGSLTLRILGKGKGTQFETIDLSPATVAAILDWLQARGGASPDAPLFIALDRAHQGNRLTGEAVRQLVVNYSQKAGLTKQMSPHRVRHSAITAALDATGGNVRMVKKLSRHANLDTLLVYDDNRQRAQAQVTGILADMI